MADQGTPQSQNPWPLPKFHFQLKWDDTEIAFREVSGLDTETQPLEHRAGNTPVFSAIKMPGVAKTGTVTLKKGVLVKDNVLFEWFSEIQMNTIKRKTITISLLDESQAPTMVWTLTNAFPLKITGTDLKAEGNEVAIESIEFAHEGITIENA